jgi:hypothetical protein
MAHGASCSASTAVVVIVLRVNLAAVDRIAIAVHKSRRAGSNLAISSHARGSVVVGRADQTTATAVVHIGLGIDLASIRHIVIAVQIPRITGDGTEPRLAYRIGILFGRTDISTASAVLEIGLEILAESAAQCLTGGTS